MNLEPISLASVASLAVIPTVFGGGALTLLGLLFPAACGGLALLLRRWVAVLTTVSLASTFSLLSHWYGSYLLESWWESELVLWSAVTFLFCLGWAMRAKSSATIDGALATPTERTMLVLVTLLAVSGLLYGFPNESSLGIDTRSLIVICSGSAAGLYHTSRLGGWWFRKSTGKVAWTTETVVLAAMAIASGGIVTAMGFQAVRADSLTICWTFAPAEKGWFASSPIVVGDRVFAAATMYRSSGGSGALYCLDRRLGKPTWTFTDEGRMKPVLSSPCFAEGRIYIGEGFHEDVSCNLYCIDAASGRKVWRFATNGHTESSPHVVGANVYFGAGDDGLYCLDSQSGALHWHLVGPHVDGSPAIEGGRVYAGSGYGAYEVFCVDAITGTRIWSVPLDLSSFASPTVANGHVFFGLGNGTLVASAQTPAGALLSLDCATGRTDWRYNVTDAVHACPIVIGGDVIFASRDHCCYCLDRNSGTLRWKRDLRSPIVAAPFAIVRSELGPAPAVCIVATDASVSWLDAATGLPYSTLEMRDLKDVVPPFISSPTAILEATPLDRNCRLYVGGCIGQSTRQPALFCIE
jgi:outer membrane protein assembly factor BamB